METNGCMLLRHEMNRYATFLKDNGWLEVDSPKKADMVLVTTCAVIQDAEDRSVEMIKRNYQRKSGIAKFLVGGCLPGINPSRIRKIGKDIILFTNQNAKVLNQFAKLGTKIEGVTSDGLDTHRITMPGPLHEKMAVSNLLLERIVGVLDKILNTKKFSETFNYSTYGRFFWKEDDLCEVKVAEGCNLRCSYCAVSIAKGRLRSRPPEDILKEVKKCIDKGCSKIALLGDELGNYGCDADTNLVELLKRILRIEGDYRLAIRYIDPSMLIGMFSSLKKIFASGKIYYFCSAAQSGSNKVLREMNRHYNSEEFKECIKTVRKEFPEIFIHSQMIVGFPSETEGEFQESLDLLEDCQFDLVHVNEYSKRPGTSAAQMENQIPQETKERRAKEMKRLIRKIRRGNLRKRFFRSFERALKLE